jgi:hypothetical protein
MVITISENNVHGLGEYAACELYAAVLTDLPTVGKWLHISSGICTLWHAMQLLQIMII